MGERVQLDILHPSFQDPALTVFPIKLALPWASFGYCFTQPAVAALKLLDGVLMLELRLPRSGVSC